jgi:hypothetical protein
LGVRAPLNKWVKKTVIMNAISPLYIYISIWDYTWGYSIHIISILCNDII